MSEHGAPTTEESIERVEYEVPLLPEHLLDLGRVTAILSQIDHLLTESLSSASRTPAWAAYIFAERATMSAKIAMFDSILGGVPDPDAKRAGKKLVKELYRVNDDRNILFHGMWALHLNPKTKVGHPACIWQRKTPIRPTDLPEIAARAAKVSRGLGGFLARVNPLLGEPPWSKPRRLFIATENVDLVNFPGGGLKKASI
jgi:hypothetical protein